jgi:hypothetical protein
MAGGPRGRAADTTMTGGAVAGGRTTLRATTVSRGTGRNGCTASANVGAESGTQSGQIGQSAGWCGAEGASPGGSSLWQSVTALAKEAIASVRWTTAPDASCAMSASSVSSSPGPRMRRWLMAVCQHTESCAPHKSTGSGAAAAAPTILPPQIVSVAGPQLPGTTVATGCHWALPEHRGDRRASRTMPREPAPQFQPLTPSPSCTGCALPIGLWSATCFSPRSGIVTDLTRHRCSVDLALPRNASLPAREPQPPGCAVSVRAVEPGFQFRVPDTGPRR